MEVRHGNWKIRVVVYLNSLMAVEMEITGPILNVLEARMVRIYWYLCTPLYLIFLVRDNGIKFDIIH